MFYNLKTIFETFDLLLMEVVIIIVSFSNLGICIKEAEHWDGVTGVLEAVTMREERNE